MNLVKNRDGFSVKFGNIEVINHTKSNPFLYIGSGKENISQNYGDFHIDDKLIDKIPLTDLSYDDDRIILSNCGYSVEFSVSEEGNRVIFKDFKCSDTKNRLFIRIESHKNERLFGCGEQFSYLNLKGRDYEIWTREPGVGRDKTSYISFQADRMGVGGGDYHYTNYPQPTYISDSKYLFHMNTGYYSKFDFGEDEYTEITLWGMPDEIFFEDSPSFTGIMDIVTKEFGTQPMLPDWMMDGIILGMQGGTDKVLEKVRNAKAHGIKVAGVWCQDWVGKKVTSFGKRLRWCWRMDENTYPELPKLIDDLERDGIKFLAYINPYLLEGTDLYKEAKDKGYFIKRKDGSDYIADFGEFNCGSIDFTNPYAMEWYKGVIRKNMIDIGIKGWMADFGEYIPVDAVFYNGETGETMHNKYPALWARCNYEAVKDSGNLGNIVYFMRAGSVGSQKYSTLMWNGDQSVDFTMHDGIATTIPASISLGLMGNGLSHFDLGAYTSLFGNVRTEELMLRYLEYAVFTPVMRTHEGNRPDENFQYDQSEHCLNMFSRFTRIRTQLMPYIRDVVKENAETGIGAMRPLFMHYDDDESLDTAYEYLFGRDLLVAPVYKKGISEWKVYLPEDQWVRLFSGEEYSKGTYTVDAELGNIPVFYRKSSKYGEIFKDIKL